MAIEHTGQVTPAVVDQFCRYLRDEKQQKPATIAGYLQVIAKFYSWLELESPVDKQIKKDWKPYAKYVKPRPHFFTAAEYRKMLEACDRIGHKELDPEGNKILVIREGERDPLWWKTYISVLYWLGLRLEEVSQLIWADIDLDQGDIKIQEHDRLKGVFDWSPKGKSVRDLSMPDELVLLLKQMKLRSDETYPYVFLGKDRYEYFVKKGLPKKTWKLMNNILRRVQADFALRPASQEGDIHDLRRTFVTRWMDEPGVNARDVQSMAGHADVETTLTVYTMMREGETKNKMRKVYAKRGHGQHSKAATKSKTA